MIVQQQMQSNIGWHGVGPRVLVLGLIVLAALGAANLAQAGTIEVTTEVDVVANDGEISLREAILMANAEPGSEILFSGNHVLTTGVLPPITADRTTLQGVGDARIDGTNVSPAVPCFDPTGPVRGPAGIEIAASEFTLNGVDISGFQVGVLVLADGVSLSEIKIKDNSVHGPGKDGIRLAVSDGGSLDGVMVAENTIQGLNGGVIVAAEWFSTGAIIQDVEIEDNVILDLVLLPFCPPFISRPLDAVGVLAGSVGEEIFDNFVELEGSGNTIRNSGTPGTAALTLLGGGFDCGKGFGNVVHASWHDNTVENYDSVAQVFGSFFANGGSAFLSLEDNVGKSLTASGVFVIGGVGNPPGAPSAQCNLAPGDFFGTGAAGTASVEAEDNVFRAAALRLARNLGWGIRARQLRSALDRRRRVPGLPGGTVRTRHFLRVPAQHRRV